ncbi:MAG: ATP-binding protein [Acidobacteriota bacterium]
MSTAAGPPVSSSPRLADRLMHALVWLLLGAASAVAYAGEEGSWVHVTVAVVALIQTAAAIRLRSHRLFSALVCVAIVVPLFVSEGVSLSGAALGRVAADWRVAGIRRAFEAMRRDVRGAASRAITEVAKLDRRDSEGRFTLLNALLIDRYSGYVLYQRGQPISWAGDIPGFFVDIPQRAEFISQAQSRTYYTFVADVPTWNDCKLAVYRLMSSQAGVWNRWMLDYDIFGLAPGMGERSVAIEYLDIRIRAGPGGEKDREVIYLPDDGSPHLLRIIVNPQPAAAGAGGGVLLACLLLVPILRRSWHHYRSRSAWAIAHAVMLAAVIHSIFGEWTGSAVAGPVDFALPVSGHLFSSPLDLLLAVLVLLVACAVATRTPLSFGSTLPRPLRYAASFVLTLLVAGLIVGYQRFLQAVVENSSGNVLMNPLAGSGPGGGIWSSAFLVLQSALLISLGLATYIAAGVFAREWRMIQGGAAGYAIHGVLCVLAVLVSVAAFRHTSLPFYPTLLGFLVLGVGAVLGEGGWRWRRIVAYTLPAVAFLQFSVDHFSERNRRALTERYTVPRITGERAWARYLLGRAQHQTDAFLSSRQTLDSRFAFRMWSQTDLAQFGFSSGIEILDSAGQAISRFELNVERWPAADLPAVDLNWSVRELEGERPAAGEENARNALLAERAFGPPDSRMFVRMLVRLTYENLSFLSTTNPYTALFRSPRLEILEERLFGGVLSLLVVGADGAVVFNPSAIDFTLTPANIERLDRERLGRFWISFESGGKSYFALLFRNRSETCMLFYPRTSAAGYVAVYVRLLLHGAVLILLPLGLGSGLLRRPLGYAGKVYVGMLLASLIPLLANGFLLRTYFDRRLRNETERRGISVAQVTRKFIEDFVAYRIEHGESPEEIFRDDIANWIQRIMRQDIQIYAGTELVATSQRELFDSGILPLLVDGEIFERIVRERAPFCTTYGHVGNFRLMNTSTPLGIRGLAEPMILTVPMAIQETESALEREELGQSILLISTIIVLLALAIAHRLARRISKPIETLVEGTSEIARGHFDFSIRAEGHDEVRTLVDSFNKMAQDLKTYQEETIKASRLRVLAEIARRVAHEIKNPLTPIQLSVEHLRQVYNDKSPDFPAVLNQCLDNVLREVEVLRKMSRDFGLFSRTQEPRWERVDLRAMIDEMTAPYLLGLAGAVQVVTRWNTERTEYELDREKTQRALSNVFINAVQATETGRIEWDVDQIDSTLQVRLTDTGSGIPPEVIQKLFQPYFSTKDRGTGLGLAIARKDIEDQGGSIGIESSLDVGTTVTVRLPVRDPGEVKSDR